MPSQLISLCIEMSHMAFVVYCIHRSDLITIATRDMLRSDLKHVRLACLLCVGVQRSQRWCP